MSLSVFLAVLGAALLHALWNALIRGGASRLGGIMIMTLVQGSGGALIALTRPLPAAEVWPWLLASGAFHAAYKLFLAFAYEHGDLSRVYPIARGTAPMLVLGFGAVFLADVLTGSEYAGVIILGVGIALMARGVFLNGESRRLLPFAFGSALATAGYSVVDGLGARVSGDAVAYVAWLFFFDALMLTPMVLALRGTAPFTGNGARAWRTGTLAAAASYAAYAIAVWAMTLAPIALVAALRETSILFAVLIGWLFFQERMDRGKAIAALLIVAGVALTRL